MKKRSVMEPLENIDQKKLVIRKCDAKSIKKDLEKFVCNVTHNLRSPLNSILGLTDILLNDQVEKPELLLKEISNSINRMDVTISEIMKYSKNSVRENEMQELDMNNIVTTCFDDVKFMNKSDTKLLFKYKNTFPFHSDKSKITIIIQNLISNAVKYYDKEKKHSFLKVEVSISKSNCKIIVQDNGIGISDQHQANVFDIFYRANDRVSGNGVGLFILKEMVCDLGGQVILESKEKVGTKISINIPNTLIS